LASVTLIKIPKIGKDAHETIYVLTSNAYNKQENNAYGHKMLAYATQTILV